VTHSLTEQRSRPELVADLYDRHAAGLFAYCADQLGDLGSAGDVLVAVLGGVPVAAGQPAPQRAALYAFARREILRRDVVYSPPVVDPIVDPASALVERALSELRLQQREVLLLTQVCGLNRDELAWVLDVAPDTAEELAVNAAGRFKQSLAQALAIAEKRVPKPIADIYAALAVAPLRDVLGRLPWPSPPGTLRIHFAGSLSATPAPLFVKPRWPVPPNWPLPLDEADPASTTRLFPAELLTPPSPTRTPEHDATTAPMPKLRRPSAEGPAPFPSPVPFGETQTPFAAFEPRRKTPGGPPPKAPDERSLIMRTPMPADVLDDRPPPRPQAAPATGDVILPMNVPPATGDFILPSDVGPLFTPRSPAKDREPVYRMPSAEPAAARPVAAPKARRSEPDTLRSESETRRPESETRRSGPEARRPKAVASEPDTTKSEFWQQREARKPAGSQKTAPGKKPGGRPGLDSYDTRKPVVRKARPLQGPPKRRPSKKSQRPRHLDWAWELIGFVICVVIAMIVFFSVPMILKP
jgi:DNA-directed RNA polymerase specialized sigma24 family protein